MKTISIKIKGQNTFLFVMCITLLILISCTKDKIDTPCSNCGTPSLYQLIVDFPPVQTPGYLTLMKATVLGDITYPISISWYASKDLYPQSLQQVDTLMSGNKAWYSFMFPALYKASSYNKGPYNIRCVVHKINPVNDETLVEKTVKIKTTL